MPQRVWCIYANAPTGLVHLCLRGPVAPMSLLAWSTYAPALDWFPFAPTCLVHQCYCPRRPDVPMLPWAWYTYALWAWCNNAPIEPGAPMPLQHSGTSRGEKLIILC